MLSDLSIYLMTVFMFFCVIRSAIRDWSKAFKKILSSSLFRLLLQFLMLISAFISRITGRIFLTKKWNAVLVFTDMFSFALADLVPTNRIRSSTCPCLAFNAAFWFVGV